MDPHFAEQFAVARPTPRYAAILEALPDAYVGTDIKPVVEFLCGELAAAFKVGRPAPLNICKQSRKVCRTIATSFYAPGLRAIFLGKTAYRWVLDLVHDGLHL